MKYYRQPVKGIDEPIQRIQDYLHDELLRYWGLEAYEDQYQCYGRAHKVPSESGVGYDPAWYSADGNYKRLGLDDTFAALSFFGIGDETTIEATRNVSQAHLIFFLHLGKLAPNLGDVRADLEAREIVQAVLGANLFGFKIEKIITGVQRVMEGYNIGRTNINQTGVQAKRGEKNIDMHPFHVFRINGTLPYDKPQLI